MKFVQTSAANVRYWWILERRLRCKNGAIRQSVSCEVYRKTGQEVLTDIDRAKLLEALPSKHHAAAVLAMEAVVELLARPQCTGRFSVRAEGQNVWIPSRLHFASERLRLNENDEAWPFARALQTRSNDGFERQRASRDLLADLRPWAAPFVVALIGEYVVEILLDIFDALTPDVERTLGAFIGENEVFWATTKRRVTSYWSEYHRWNIEPRRSYRRDEYVGFKLVDRLEAAAFGST